MTHKKKSGGQPANQNASKHGFYSRKLTPAQQASLADAMEMKGLDQEIGILRLKISSLVANDPANTPVLVLAMSSLIKLLQARHKLGYDSQDKLLAGVSNVLRDVVVPLITGTRNQSLATPGPVPSNSSRASPKEVEGPGSLPQNESASKNPPLA